MSLVTGGDLVLCMVCPVWRLRLKKGAFSEPPLTRVWRGRRKNQRDWCRSSGGAGCPDAGQCQARVGVCQRGWDGKGANLARQPAGRTSEGGYARTEL